MMPYRSRLAPLLRTALLLAALVGGSAAAQAASFQVSPTRFEFSLARRFTNFFTVTNNSGKNLRLRVSTSFLDTDAKGDLTPVSGSPYDMAGWMVINPRRINLAPSEKRVVRFTVRPPAGLSPGEYRTVVFFEELPPRPEGHSSEGTQFQIQFLTRLGITIYGIVGEPKAKPAVNAPSVHVAADGIHVQVLAHNAGQVHVMLECKATLADSAGQSQGTTEGRLVLQRGQQRPFDLKLPRPPAGTYRLHLVASAGSESVLDTELPVTVGADAK